MKITMEENFQNISQNLKVSYFKIKNQQGYPRPYPNGWYKVCNSQDLPPGGIKYVEALGERLVVFRTEQGNASVMDA
jgi:phenylpropionate dioxygenase-like ring-hydroxylating dioxygenase large terminal subunit